jgi:hypothetical protein
MRRNEVYSPHYRPTDEEMKEIREIEAYLGFHRWSARPKFFRSTSQGSVASASSDKAAWNKIAKPAEGGKKQKHCSIVLKRGPCLLLAHDDANAKDEDEAEKEAELIILTRGLVIATLVPSSDSSSRNSESSKVLPRQLYRAIPWSDVHFVQPCFPAAADMDDLHAARQSLLAHSGFQIELSDGARYIFICGTSQEREAWMEALETVWVRHVMHSGKVPSDYGWQYRVIYKPGYTMAVTNNVLDDVVGADDLNKLDSYHGYAPLHYAVRYNFLPAIDALLRAGADPDLPDKDGRTAMSHAVADQLPETTTVLLETYGAKSSREQAEQDQRGELFGRVKDTEVIVQEKRRQMEQKRQAEAAAAEMNKNMQLLKERGEKIEQLGDKASELNQGAQDFASMARQLKEKNKNKKWWEL